MHAARAIGEVADVKCDALTKANHAIIRVGIVILTVRPYTNRYMQMLYAQKYFKATLPIIMAHLDGNQGEIAHLSLLFYANGNKDHVAYLIVLTSLISHLPKVAYVSEMSSVRWSSISYPSVTTHLRTS